MIKKKSPGNPDLTALKKHYGEDVEKNAVQCGKFTKGFQE